MSPRLIRRGVVLAKVDLVRDLIGQIETLPIDSLDQFLADRRMVAAGESYLRRGLEALLDLGRHLLAKGFAVAAIEYKQVGQALGEQGVLDEHQARLLRQMAGYRNRLVHFYDEVSPEELYSILTDYRGDILAVLDMLETWIDEHPERIDNSL